MIVNPLLVLTSVLQLLFSNYYLVHPKPILNDYLKLFREEYNVSPTDVILMNTWEDSGHVYFDGKVIDGYENDFFYNQTISLNQIETALYSTECDEQTVDIGLLEEYDDQVSFSLCFHRDSSICLILSYENDYMNGIPVLMNIVQKYQVKTIDDDPDAKDSYPFIVDNAPKYSGDLGSLISLISQNLNQMGISSFPSRRILIVLNVAKNGEASVSHIRGSTGNPHFDKNIVEYIGSIVKDLTFIPGSHRGAVVNALFAIPVFIDEP